MDTFNFSFFDDKPEAPPEAPEEKPAASPRESAADNSFSALPNVSAVEDSPAPDTDPFGFDEFTAKESPSLSDLSLNSEFFPDPPPTADVVAPQLAPDVSDDGLPDFALVRSVSQAISPDLEFPDFDSDEIDAETLFASSNLDFNVPSVHGDFAPVEDFDLDPLVASTPKINDIRASIEPMVFISPASLPPSAPAEPDALEDLDPIAPATPSEDEISLASTAPATSVESAISLEDLAPIEAVVSEPPTPLAGPTASKPARFLTADDPYGEVAPPRERLRVAILGASGIGKNHARWFAKHSCDVVSFLGSNAESVALTRSHLQAHMGFSGQGFSDLTQLLNQTGPQAVCIASPSPVHYALAMQCLEAGVHVLCEKPLVYSSARTNRENLDGARELLKAAAKRNLILATQLQYGAATPILCRLAGVSPYEVGDFVMEVETTNPRAPRDPKELWIELAPHPLSVAQYLAGEGAQIVEGTVQMLASRTAHATEIASRFGIACEGGRLMMCRSIVRWFDKIVDNREPRRRFAFNGRVVQYSGVKSPDGTYMAQYVAPDGYISHYSDPVDYLVGNFVRSCWNEDELLLSAEQGVQNLEWLLTTADKL